MAAGMMEVLMAPAAALPRAAPGKFVRGIGPWSLIAAEQIEGIAAKADKQRASMDSRTAMLKGYQMRRV